MDKLEAPVSCAIEIRVGKVAVEVKPGFNPQLLTEVVRGLSYTERCQCRASSPGLWRHQPAQVD